METLSVKELRGELPRVLKKVEGGKSFVIIYHSRPVGELIPFRKRISHPGKKSLYDLLKKPYGEVGLLPGETSVTLIRQDRD